MAEARRHLWRLAAPAPLLKQAAQGCVQIAFVQLQGWTLPSLPCWAAGASAQSPSAETDELHWKEAES